MNYLKVLLLIVVFANPAYSEELLNYKKDNLSIKLNVNDSTYKLSSKFDNLKALNSFYANKPPRLVINLGLNDNIKKETIKVKKNSLIKNIKLVSYKKVSKIIIFLKEDSKPKFKLLKKADNLLYEFSYKQKETLDEPVKKVAKEKKAKNKFINSHVPKIVSAKYISKNGNQFNNLNAISFLGSETEGNYLEIILDNKTEYKILKTSSHKYIMLIDKTKLAGKHLFNPFFPPKEFEGLNLVSLGESQNKVQIIYHIEEGYNLESFLKENKIIVKILKDTE